MRTIKFRGITAEAPHRWVYGDLINEYGESTDYEELRPHISFEIKIIGGMSLTACEVIPETVGQFICEINDTQYWEGDLSHYKYEDGFFNHEQTNLLDWCYNCLGYQPFASYEDEETGKKGKYECCNCFRGEYDWIDFIKDVKENPHRYTKTGTIHDHLLTPKP